jgi:signal peptidase II
MVFLFYSLFVVGIVAVDQITKFLTVANIDLYQQVPALKGIFNLTFVRNTGAAWSMMEGMRWAFVALFVVLTGLILWEYFKKPLPFSKFERWCIAAVYGGGLGNVIDRVRLGYVVDMIDLDFMNFPVFNVADCFITCGCIALMVSMIFFNKEFWKDEKKEQ